MPIIEDIDEMMESGKPVMITSGRYEGMNLLEVVKDPEVQFPILDDSDSDGELETDEPAEAPAAPYPKCKKVTVNLGPRVDEKGPAGAAKLAPSNGCPSCPKQFKSIACMRKHKSLMHGGPDGKAVEIWCKYCLKAVSANNFRVHEEMYAHKANGLMYKIRKEVKIQKKQKKQLQQCK